MSAQPLSLDFISNRFGDEFLYDVNRTTFDAVGANVLFERQFGPQLEQANTLFVVLGTDSGLLPKWIANREHHPGSRFVFIELEDLLTPIRRQFGEVLNSAGFGLTSAAEWKDLIEDFRFKDYAYLGRIRFALSLGAGDAHLADYRVIESSLRLELSEYERHIQRSLGSRAFLRRQLENVADNLQPAIALTDSHNGNTGVVLGGGPSLDDILPWVKRNRERLTVIAVSRIARRLLKDGIEPDIVVSIDPHPVSFDVSKESLQFQNSPLLIHNNYVSPLVLSQWPGLRVYCGHRFPWETAQNGQNWQSVGPTVTNLALASAVEMGFSRVILGGVDLCYSAQGHTYATGSNERDAGTNLGFVGRQIETNGGRLADTSPSFAQAVTTLSHQAKIALSRGCQFINPSVNAAKIEGVEHLPVDRIELNLAKPVDTAQMVAEMIEDKRGRCSAGLVIARKELAWARNQLNQVRTLSLEALNCNEHLFGRAGKQSNFKFKKRMDQIERRLDRKFRGITTLIKKFAIEGFLGLMQPNSEHEWSDEEIHAWGRRYYETYLAAVDQFEQLVSASQERVVARLEEFQAKPDFDILLQQWEKDKSPGRAALYRRNNPEAMQRAGTSARKAFDTMQKQFEATLLEKDTAHARRMRNTHTLAPVRSKLQLLFRESNAEELDRIAQALFDQASEEAKELSALACGYLAELNQQPQDAMNFYRFILVQASERLDRQPNEPLPDRVEDALRRMSFLSLASKDIDNALLSLSALSTMSCTYAPQYAEALRLAGKTQAAIDVYTNYLQQAPLDLATMLRLGKLLQEAGALQAARESYNYVLSRSPGNQAAEVLLESLDEVRSTA